MRLRDFKVWIEQLRSKKKLCWDEELGIEKHAYLDYPCREVSEQNLKRAILEGAIIRSSDSNKDSKRKVLEIVDPDTYFSVNRKKLRIVIDFSEEIPFVISVFRENSPSPCCITKEGAHLPECKFAKKRKRKL